MNDLSNKNFNKNIISQMRLNKIIWRQILKTLLLTSFCIFNFCKMDWFKLHIKGPNVNFKKGADFFNEVSTVGILEWKLSID